MDPRHQERHRYVPDTRVFKVREEEKEYKQQESCLCLGRNSIKMVPVFTLKHLK